MAGKGPTEQVALENLSEIVFVRKEAELSIGHGPNCVLNVLKNTARKLS